MTAYYNEFDKYAAQWLRNLIKAGHIAPGYVDERSIEDICPDELAGYTQCHFFAGIGVWPLALRRAGWPDDRPVWTGSCPCQPFSAAGKGLAFADERHLWPAFGHLIKERRPAIVLGDQVASKDVDAWIDLVHADMEGLGYAFGSVPFPSAGVGAPHIRDRNYWVGIALADANNARLEGRGVSAGRSAQRPAGVRGVAGRLADANGRDASTERQQRGGEQRQQPEDGGAGGMGNASGGRFAKWWTGSGPALQGAGAKRGEQSARSESTGVISGRVEGLDANTLRLADADGIACGQGRALDGGRDSGSDAQARPGYSGDGVPDAERPGPTNGFWRDADWLGCTDGKWRPVESGSFPLVASPTGGVGRVRAGWDAPAGKEGQGHRAGRLKGYGNAVNAEAARVFIECVMGADAPLLQAHQRRAAELESTMLTMRAGASVLSDTPEPITDQAATLTR